MHRRQLLTASVLAGAALPPLARPKAATPAEAKPRKPVVTRHGARLFVRDWGAGKPIVFLAGWTLTSDMWAYQMAPCAIRASAAWPSTGAATASPTIPAVATTSTPWPTTWPPCWTPLDLRDVTLVAHSMAGGEATRYLTRHGKAGRVAKVLYLAPTLPFLTRTADNPMGLPAEVFEQGRKVFMTDFPKWIEDNTEPFVVPSTSQPMRAWIQGMMRRASMKAVIDCNRAMTATDFRPELKALAVPALIIHGDKDASALLELTGRRAAALIPGGRLKVYAGAPHGLFITHMEPLNADIAAFAKASRPGH